MRILVAYDGSISADAAVEDLPRAGLPQTAEALVVCVADSAELVHSQTTTRGKTQKIAGASSSSKGGKARTIAASAAERIQSYFPQWNVSSDALCGSPAKVFAEATGSWHPDLFVIGSHGRSGVRRLFLGSVSWELIHRAACSVRVARLGGSPNPGDPIRVVIGIDGSEEASMAVRSVAARCWPEKTEAQIVSAVQTLAPGTTSLEASTFAQEPAYSVIREADERLRFRLGNIAEESANALRRAGLIATTRLVDGDPREAILTAAEVATADTIFVGARGLGRMERLLLGSVSSYVVTHAHCSVEVVRAQ
jgi:nucleotide-binding universal stress UspA family protein